MGGLDESHRELVEKASLGKHSIFQVADECDKLFDEFSQKSTETGQKLAPDFPKASSVEEVPLTYRVGEFHSRFRAWASYLGVFAGEHMNLDARLRERPELADIVLLTMDKLRANLQDLLSAEQPPAPSETDVEDGDSSSSSSWGIVDDSGDNQQNNLRDFIIGCIRESVGKLNRLAIVIRSSASISTPSDFFARVRRYAARHLAQDMASLETSFNHTLQFLYPNADDCFRRQLLKSALFRFAKLRYWQSHPEDQESDTRQIEEPTLGSSLDKGTPDVDDVSQKGTEDRKETVPITAAASSTNLSVTKAPVKIEEPEVPIVHSETRSQRREGTSVWMSTAQYPETPPVLLNPSNDQTVCPYCYKRQEDEIFTDKESWEHHIDEDLEPFVCIFETCGETASFSNFQDWRRHLRQVHTDDWLWQISPEPAYRCNHPSHFESDPDARPEDRSDNNIVISSFADIQDHFEKNHGQIISIPKAEDVYLDHPFPFTSLLVCPLCQASLHDSVSRSSTFLPSDAIREANKMAKHISNHIHNIAFRLLDINPESRGESGTLGADTSNTPLAWAAKNGHDVVVELLLEQGAHTESADKIGQTPLLWAAKVGNEAIVRLLLDRGALTESADKMGRTPLMWAANGGNEAIVRLLLDQGARTESADKMGRTPLMWAAKGGNEAIVRLLLEEMVTVGLGEGLAIASIALQLVEVAQKCAEWAEQFGAFGEVASGFHVRYNHEFTKMQALQHVLLDPEKFKLGKPLIELMEKERQHDIRDVLLCILREVQSFETLVSKYGAREVEENGKNADSQGVIDVSKIALEEALPDLVERERFVQTKTICIKRPFGPQRALWASTGKKAAEKSLSRIHEWLQLVRDEIDQFFWTFKIPENTKKGTSDKLKSLAADADLVTLTLSNPMRMRQLALQLEMPPEEIDDTFPSNMMTDAAAKKQARAAEQERETQRQQAEAVDNLRDILKKRNLAICVGSGVTLYSVSTETKPRLTWTGLVNNGFDYLERELPDFYQQQKKAFERARELLDDDKATAGDLIEAASKLNSFFQSHPGKLADWLSHQFEKLPHYVNSPAVLESLKKLHRNGALLMTTNYDGLMEKHCDLSPLDSSDKDKLMEFNRRLCDGVFHPHGYWKNPKHIVLDAIDYYKVRHDDGVQETLRNIFTERTILFVGCGGGLADPNFGELLKWLGEKQKNIGSSHYILLPKDELNPMPQLPLKHVRCEGYDAIGPWLENLLDQSERSDRVVEHRLRVVTTVQWHIDPEQLIPRDGLSKAAPALATMGDTLFAVWCGRNNDNNNLYWSSCRYSGDKPIWSKPKKLHERALSAERPAIAAMEDQLVVSWKAVSNDCLWYSTRRIGSQDWMIPNKIPGAGSSAGPSLALWKLNSTTRVYALWKGISAPADQHVYWTYYDGEKWYPKKALHAISTNVSPNLVCCRGKIYVAWKDKKTEKIFWACVDEDAAMSDIRAKVLHTNARTNRAPALAKVDGVIYALWKGQGNSTDMWLALLPEGEDEFKPAQIVEKMKTTVAPTLVGWDNRLVLAWKAIGNQYQMWWIYGGVRTEQSISS